MTTSGRKRATTTTGDHTLGVWHGIATLTEVLTAASDAGYRLTRLKLGDVEMDLLPVGLEPTQPTLADMGLGHLNEAQLEATRRALAEMQSDFGPEEDFLG